MYFNYKIDSHDSRMVVAYSRVSTKEQLEGFSIYNQEETAKRIAVALGLQLDKIYKDEGISAYKEVKRPGFQELIKDVVSNKIKIVIVWKSDRLIRNFVKSEKVYQLFIKHNVNLISATQLWDFTTADGRKDVRKRSIDDQYESERTSERVKEVARASAGLGNYPKGHVPLGLRRIHKDYKTAPLTIDEVEGPQVNYIFETMFRNRWGIKKMLHWLNSVNYMDRKWNESFLYRMLLNPIYIGTYVNSVSDPTYSFENHMPALVKQKVFDGVGDLIHGRYYTKKYKYTYKGLIYCSSCNHKMTPNPTNKKSVKKLYLYYHCEKCNHRINETKLNKLIVPKFDYIICKEDIGNEILTNKQNELIRIDKMISELDNYYLDNIIDYDYYRKEKGILIKNRFEIESFINTYKKEQIVLFENLDFRSKRKWLKEHVEHVNFDFNLKAAVVIYKK